MGQLAPQVGSWYKDLQLDTTFEVVAVDDTDATIETQYVDGEIAEIDFESWRQLPIEPASAPEDWRSGYAMNDDFDSDAVAMRRDWSEAINQIEPEISIDFSDA